MASSKHHELGMVKLLNTLSFVVLEYLSDSSLFIKLESNAYLLILLYVDDMIITGDNELEISNLRKDLSVRFEMKNLGQIGCFLGLEVEKSNRGYFVSRKGYAESLLEHFIMGESKERLLQWSQISS